MRDSTGPSLESLALRLARLERQLLLWKVAAVVLLLAAAVAVTALPTAQAQDKPRGKEITSEKFVLLDKDGGRRAGLMMKDGEPVLAFQNAEGKFQTTIGFRAGVPAIIMGDAKNRGRLLLALSNSGDPVMQYLDADEKAKLALSLTTDEEIGTSAPSLFMTDQKHQSAISLGVNQVATSIVVRDGAGTSRLSLVESKGNAFLAIFDAKGNQVGKLPR
jgi:hypothetical protein